VTLRRLPALALVTLAVSAGPADARTMHVQWRDAQPLGGGRAVYRTTKIWVHGDAFSVTVSIANRSPYELRFFRSRGWDPAYPTPPMFGLAWRPPLATGTIQSRAFRTVGASSFAPSFPKRIAAGKTWRGTFSGRSRLLRTHRTWWVTFGLLVPWQGKHPAGGVAARGGGYWVSAKTFST
jgi:hypothetical protein